MPILVDSQLKAVFNDKGALTGLEHKPTGWNVVGRGDLGLSFRMLVPLPGRRDNPVDGNLQSPPLIRMAPNGKSLAMEWEGIKSLHGGMHNISFHAVVSLENGRLTFSGSVINHSELIVENVAFPCFSELAMPPGEKQVDGVGAGGYIDRFPLMPRFSGRGDYYGTDFPTATMGFPDSPFAISAGENHGLYAGVHDTSIGEMVQFTFEVKPGLETLSWIGQGTFTPGAIVDGKTQRLEISCWHIPYARPGRESVLSPIVVAPYAGSWHRGADIYKEWRKTWFERPEAPDWSRDIHSWQLLQMNSPEDELRYRYADLPEFGRECAKHGVAAIQVVGWNDGGQDRNNPSHDTDPRLGTAEEFRKAIKDVQAMGVKVILFTKFTWADRSTERYRKDLHRCAVRDPYGDDYVYMGYQYHTITQLSDINTRRLIPMCMLDPAYREVADMEFRKCLDLGADGMLYDEAQHHGAARYCFSPGHGHPVPAYIYAGDARLVEGFRKITAERDPDFLFGGEALYDLEWRHYSITYTRIPVPGHLPAQRYIDPYQGLMVTVSGFNDRDTINACLLNRYIIIYEPFNFKGRLDDFPRTLEYGKRMDSFRRRHRDFLWDGEFQSTQGASVTMDGKPTEHYSVFIGRNGKRGMAAANYNSGKSVEVMAEFGGQPVNLFMASPEEPEPRPFSGRISLAPSSAVLIFEA